MLFGKDLPAVFSADNTYPDIEKLVFRGARELDESEQALGDLSKVKDSELLKYYLDQSMHTRERARNYGWIQDDDMNAWRQFAENEGLFTARWAKLGFPRVVLNEKQVSQFIVSSINADALAEINPPWGHFMIQIPRNMLKLVNNGKPDTIERIMVRIPDADSQRWLLMKKVISEAQLPSKIPSLNMQWRIMWDTLGDRQGFVQNTAAELLKYSHTDETMGIAHLPPVEKRTSMLMTQACIRIVFCTVIEMMMHRSEFEHKPQQHKIPLHKREMRKKYPYTPVSNKYVFTRPIEINCREAAENYLNGNTSSPSVRFLVRGHYRWQPHGPRSSLRKWTFISPFWKGKENEEIAVRPHTMK